MKEKFNPWLPYNERIRDFIRWDHVIVYLSVMLFMWGVLESAWGLLLGYVICNLFQNMCGGLQGDWLNEFPYEYKNYNWKCSAGIEGCEICNNEYSQEFKMV